MITVTKKFSFCYGHFLPDYQGKCHNQHGHNSELEVEIAGDKDTVGPSNGMIIDFADLKEGVETWVISHIDHQNLNEKMTDAPTAENIVEWVANSIDAWLQTKYYGLTLVRVRLTETPTSWAEWRPGRVIS